MDNEISIAQALNHVQSWLNAGEYDKVIQGCQEILQIEPGNARATALMKLAEERRMADVKGEPMPESAPMPEPEPTPAPQTEPAKDPLASLQVEEAPTHKSMHDFELPPEEDEDEDPFEKRKLFLAMLIPAVLVVLIGGGAIWWLAIRDREEEIDEIINDEPEEDVNYLEENDQRVEDIQKMVSVIEEYHAENGEYPSLTKVEAVLAKSDEFTKIPSDPRQGEIDKAGQAFGYIYAVYEGIGGENSVYILSALFEDDQGFGTPWAQGAPIKNYPDFRDYEEDNVTFIGGDEDDVETVGKGPEDEEEDEDEDEEEPKDTDDEPKVNPDN